MLDEVAAESIAARRTITRLSSLFGALALLPVTRQAIGTPDSKRYRGRTTELEPARPEGTFHEDRSTTMATNRMPTFSADDVLRMSIPPELSGYELVNGELEPVTPAGLLHGRIASRLAVRLEAHVRQQQTAGCVYVEAGFVLGLRRDPERLRGPDVSFVSQAQLDGAGGEPEGFFHGAPDLAVEIESAERQKAMQQRIQDYLDAGTPLLWVIHAETSSATVYHTDGSARLLREADLLDGGTVLPGLLIPLRELFQE
jgi:Uma2 family endonuclease